MMLAHGIDRNVFNDSLFSLVRFCQNLSKMRFKSSSSSVELAMKLTHYMVSKNETRDGSDIHASFSTSKQLIFFVHHEKIRVFVN